MWTLSRGSDEWRTTALLKPPERLKLLLSLHNVTRDIVTTVEVAMDIIGYLDTFFFALDLPSYDVSVSLISYIVAFSACKQVLVNSAVLERVI